MTERSVILDVDGTLVDTNYQHALAWYMAFRQHDVVVPLWRVHRHLGMGGDQLVAAVAGDEAERELGDELRSAHDVLYLASIQTTSAFDGARKLLEDLSAAGSPVMLASSAGQREVDHYLDLLDARSLVAGWTTSGDVEATKPEPDLVLAALAKLGTEDAVMVGDTPWDVEAARRAGISTVAVLTGGFSADELKESGAVAVYESVGALRSDLGAALLSATSQTTRAVGRTPVSASRWRQLEVLGQSVWYDNVARPALRSGLLQRIVEEDHVTGGTSNPSIFAEALASSGVYEAEVRAARDGESTEEIFERLMVADIREACDLLRPVWERTDGQDGYISIEEEASLAFDADGAVERGQEMRALVDRPNVMVKVPGTEPGVRAFQRLTRAGVSVNVTLLFSRERYAQVVEAYISGLEERLESGEDVSAIASVASFFVSRIDAKVDPLLADDSPLRGRAALANARLAYHDIFLPAFTSERWLRLANAGANLQRPLWASTGVKDPDYPPTLYVDRLVGAGTVTTVPDATLDAFRATGIVAPTLHADVNSARSMLDELAATGVDLDAITRELEPEGVERFATAYSQMIDAIRTLRAAARPHEPTS